MRGVRAVPAALPDVPGDGRGGAVAAGPDRRDARRAVARRRGDDEFVRFMETCVQCRGCEPACPSGVPFGHLMEGTREALADAAPTAPRWLRAGFAVLGRHRLLLAGSTLLALAQRLRLVPRPAGLARLPLRRGRRVRSTGDDVWLFTGCVMDAWMRDTHRARPPDHGDRRHVRRARRTAAAAPCTPTPGWSRPAAGWPSVSMRSMPGDAPIVVNSAGCGAAMKDYGHLLGTPEAAAFAARVVDVHEWLAERLDRLPPPARRLGRDRPGPVPPPPRAAGPRPCAPCSATSPTSSSSTTTAVLRRRRRLLGARSRRWPARSATARSPPSAGPRRAVGRDRRRQRQPRVRHAPRRRRGRRAPPRRPRRRGDRADEPLRRPRRAPRGDRRRARRAVVRPAPAGGRRRRDQRPAADRTLAQARRAVEKAAALLRQLAEPDA